MLNRRSIFAIFAAAAAAPAAIAKAAAPPAPRLFIGMKGNGNPALSNRNRFLAGLDGGEFGKPRRYDVWHAYDADTGMAELLVFDGKAWVLVVEG